MGDSTTGIGNWIRNISSSKTADGENKGVAGPVSAAVILSVVGSHLPDSVGDAIRGSLRRTQSPENGAPKTGVLGFAGEHPTVVAGVIAAALAFGSQKMSASPIIATLLGAAAGIIYSAMQGTSKTDANSQELAPAEADIAEAEKRLVAAKDPDRSTPSQKLQGEGALDKAKVALQKIEVVIAQVASAPDADVPSDVKAEAQTGMQTAKEAVEQASAKWVDARGKNGEEATRSIADAIAATEVAIQGVSEVVTMALMMEISRELSRLNLDPDLMGTHPILATAWSAFWTAFGNYESADDQSMSPSAGPAKFEATRTAVFELRNAANTLIAEMKKIPTPAAEGGAS